MRQVLHASELLLGRRLSELLLEEWIIDSLGLLALGTVILKPRSAKAALNAQIFGVSNPKTLGFKGLEAQVIIVGFGRVGIRIHGSSATWTLRHVAQVCWGGRIGANAALQEFGLKRSCHIGCSHGLGADGWQKWLERSYVSVSNARHILVLAS